MKDIVVTIERQYGSGGRTIGEMLSEDIGVHYYNKELTKLASEDSGIAEELFVENDEKIVKKFGKGRFLKTTNVYNGDLISPEENDFVSEKNLFNYMAKTIKKLADSGSCVIVGRAADFVLKDYENVVRVFVYAPHDFLMEQAGKKQPLTGKELEKYCEKVDESHAAYYHYYTGQDWMDMRNYDLCINSGKLGFEKSVEEIKAYIRTRFGEDVI